MEKLGAVRVRELAASGLESEIAALIDEDLSKEPVVQAFERVEKLVRLRRDLMTLANNFVSFRDFYSYDRTAIFQAGVLYLDTRACELVLKVGDADKHIALAPHANMYLLYCDCRNSKGEKRAIVAAMTAGDVDNLMVGRNGVFYDRDGNDWDATVTRIIENSISLRQAFWAPYKKAIRIAEEQIAKRTAAADTGVPTTLPIALTPTTPAVPGAPPAPVAPQPPGALQLGSRGRIDIGTIAALGVAVGGLTAALGVILQAFFGLGIWMPVGILAILLGISGPSVAVAWLKLRKRNLGPLLDANGWAVNAQARVNIPLGQTLTSTAALPPGSARNLVDPFEERARPWLVYTLFVLFTIGGLAWLSGHLDRFLPHAIQRQTLIPSTAPAHGVGPA